MMRASGSAEIYEQKITSFSSESVGEGHPDKVCDTIPMGAGCVAWLGSLQPSGGVETYAKAIWWSSEVKSQPSKLDFMPSPRAAIATLGLHARR